MKLYPIISAIFVYLSTFSDAYAVNSNVTQVPAFKGGLNEVNINRCNSAMESVCNPNDNVIQFFQCANQTFSKDSSCKQNLAFSENERGFFDVIHQYGNVSIVKAKVYAADHSDDYFIVNTQGQMISLTDQVDLKKSPIYQKLSKKFNAISLWPTATTLPKVEILNNGNIRVIFQQLLLNGCHACEQAGIARIAYDFSEKGEYLGATLIEIIPIEMQKQV